MDFATFAYLVRESVPSSAYGHEAFDALPGEEAVAAIAAGVRMCPPAQRWRALRGIIPAMRASDPVLYAGTVRPFYKALLALIRRMEAAECR